MLGMELSGKRKWGRPKTWLMDVVKEDMADIEVTEEDIEDRNNWRWKISCGVPAWEKPKEEGKLYCYEQCSDSYYPMSIRNLRFSVHCLLKLDRLPRLSTG